MPAPALACSVLLREQGVCLPALGALGASADVGTGPGPGPAVRGPFDLVFANILARPLCAMAKDLAANLAPGGTAVLAGLLANQVRWVLAAHRRQGLHLERLIPQGTWTTIVLRKRSAAPL